MAGPIFRQGAVAFSWREAALGPAAAAVLTLYANSLLLLQLYDILETLPGDGIFNLRPFVTLLLSLASRFSIKD